MNTITVSNNQFYSHYPKRIPKGTVNAETVQIRLDSEWDGLTVRIHWLNVDSRVEIAPLLERAQPNSIPWEVLTDLGELHMGLVGLDGETVIKPTIWLSYGYVVDGVDPEAGSDPQPPTPSWEQQMVEQAIQANQAAQAAQQSAQAAAEALVSAGPYAEEAQQSAEAAKVSESAAKGFADTATQQATKAQEAVASIGDAVEQAQQSAQEAQIAQESAAQSAQTAATDAQRAETASQDAQDAAARAEAVDAYPMDVADEKFALALKTDTGKGTSHEIYPDPGSNVVVTAYGFTEQEGEGDPSPKNVRPIKVGGKRYLKYVFDGTLMQVQYRDHFSYNGNGFSSFYVYASALGLDATTLSNAKGYSNLLRTVTNTASSTEREGVAFRWTSSPPYIGIRIPNEWLYPFGLIDDDFVSSQKALYDFIAHQNEIGSPFVIWAETSDGSGDLYTQEITDGASYHCECLPITEPLCDGDSVVSQQDGQCMEHHAKGYIEFDGTEEWSEYDNGSFIISISEKRGVEYSQFVSSHGKMSNTSMPGGFYIVTGGTAIVVNPTGGQFSGILDSFSGTNLEKWKSYLSEQKSAGTPFCMVYSLKTPVTYTHAPVSFITSPDATGKATVSGEKEVSAVYNKSIAKAIEELQTAILNLGGAN